MSADPDLSPLAWVAEELRRSLDTAQKALRRALREREAAAGSDVDAIDPGVLRTARLNLHQGLGALELVGQPAPARLLAAAEAAVQRLAAKPALLDAAAVEAIEAASFALLDFVARLLAGKPASPVALFPQYAAVQQLAGAERAHPADLWPHDFRWRELAAEPGVPPRAADDAARSAMESLVLGLMRAPDAAALTRTSTLCAELAAGASGPASTLWQLAAALFEAQAGGLLAADVHVKRIASRLLGQLRAFVRGGAEVSDQLAQDMLFFCAHAQPPTAAQPAPRLAAVRQVWRLDAGGDGAAVDYQTTRLGRFDPALIAQARKRVAAAKQAWAAQADDEDAGAGGALAEPFALLGDSVQRLFPDAAGLVQALRVSAAAAADERPSPTLAMEVATALLYLEASLDDGELDQPALAARVQQLAARIGSVAAGVAPQPLEHWMEELYRRVSDRQTMGSVVHELRATLLAVEREIDQYFRDPSQRAGLIPVPAQLSAMRGVLSVLGLDQASTAVLHMRDEVDALVQTEADPQRAEQAGTFDRLADNLGTLSFLIDMLSVQPALAKSLFAFDAADGRLRAVVARSERTSAFAAFDAAPMVPSMAPPIAAPAASPIAEVPAVSPPAPAASESPADAADDDQEMRAVFLEEAREVLDEARAALHALNDRADDLTALTAVRRAFHTLKGSARMVGLGDFGTAAWHGEQLYNARLSVGAADTPLLQFTGQALDFLGGWVDAIDDGRDDGHGWPAVAGAADALREGRSMAPLSAPGAAAAAGVPAVEALGTPAVPFEAPAAPEQPELAELPRLPEYAPWLADANTLSERVPGLPSAEALDLVAATDAVPELPVGDVVESAPGELQALSDMAEFAELAAHAAAAAADTAPPLAPVADGPAEVPAEEPAEEPDETPVEALAGTAAEAPAEALAEMPTATLAEAPFAWDAPVAPAAAPPFDALADAPAAAAPADLEPLASPQPPTAAAPVIEPPPEVSFELDLGELGDDDPAATSAPVADTALADPGTLGAAFDFELEFDDAETGDITPAPGLVLPPEALVSFDAPAATPAPLPFDAAPSPMMLPLSLDDAALAPMLPPAAQPAPVDPFGSPLLALAPDVPADMLPDVRPNVQLDESPAEPPLYEGPAEVEAADSSDAGPTIEASAPRAVIEGAGAEPAGPFAEPAVEPAAPMLPEPPAEVRPVPALTAAFEPEPLPTLFGEIGPASEPSFTGADADADADADAEAEAAPLPALSPLPAAPALDDVPAAPALEALPAAPAFEDLAAAPALEAPPAAETAEAAPAAEAPALLWGLDAPADGGASGFEAVEDEDPVKVIGALRIPIPLFNIFLNEADEQSRRLGTELAEWSLEHHRGLPEDCVALAHSLAGNSSTVGYTDLSALARALEHALMHSRGDAAEAALFVDASEEIRRLLHQFAAGFLRPVPHELMQRLAEHEVRRAGIVPPAPAADAEPVLDEDEDFDAVDAIDPELFPIFEEEAAELLPQLLARLADWARQPAGRGAVSACMRTLHTFKGGARLAGAMRLGELAHRLETAIERLAARPVVQPAEIERLLGRADHIDESFEALRRPAPPDAVDSALAAAPVLPLSAALAPTVEPLAGPLPAAMVGVDREPVLASESPMPAAADTAAEVAESAGTAGTAGTAAGHEPAEVTVAGAAAAAHETSEASQVPQVPQVLQALQAPAADAASEGVATAAAATPPAAAPQVRIDWRRFGALPETRHADMPEPANAAGSGVVRVRAALLDRLVNQAGEVSITRARLEAGARVLHGALGELSDNLERLRRQLRDIELQAETQISARIEAAKAAAQAFDPLEMDRFTRFQELTRFMAESVNDVATVQRTLQRTLQSTEDELAAQARLTRELQEELLRTRMVEFESTAERLYRVVRQAAKEAGRQVRLDIVGGAIEIDRGVLERMVAPFEHLLRNSVVHGIESPGARQGVGKDPTGSIVVTVTHEGNEVGVEFRDDGAGLDFARIRERALDRGLIAADAMPDTPQLADLIFLPGFSTAEGVTELAGRGVGMDVVRAEVNAMGGRIETESQPGQGTCFRLVLPLTTAVTQVVMLRAGAQTVAVPATLVEAVRRVAPAELEQAWHDGSYGYAGERMPMYWLGALLQSATAGAAPQSETLVIVRSAAQRVALHVDEVVGNQEVVVKNLGPQLSRLPGLSGITLLPSGAVAPIYNPVALAAVYGDDARATMRGLPPPGGQPLADPVPTLRAPLVLVVDDSLTVRRVMQRLLQREGYRVTLAKDGQEAIERLADERPAVLLSDIEMPRMDGFDLLRNVRADHRLAGLPVVMITSRTAQKHRDHAAALGADHYLGKPFAEDELLALVARHAGADIRL